MRPYFDLRKVTKSGPISSTSITMMLGLLSLATPATAGMVESKATGNAIFLLKFITTVIYVSLQIYIESLMV